MPSAGLHRSHQQAHLGEHDHPSCTDVARRALRTASAGSAWYISTSRPTIASNRSPVSSTARKSPGTNSTFSMSDSAAR